MKQINRILSLVILVVATVYFTACDDKSGNEKSEKEIQIDKLAGTWEASSVTYEGDPNADHANFSITITKVSAEAMTWTVTGRPAGKISPWNANGTFTFGSPVSSTLVRDDGTNVKYNVDGTNLVLTLENYQGTTYEVPGRTSSVAGTWVFTMTK